MVVVILGAAEVVAAERAAQAQHLDHRGADARRESVEQFEQDRVPRGLHHGPVKGSVGVDVRRDVVAVHGARGEGAADRAQVGRCAARGGELGALRLNGGAGLDDGEDVRASEHEVPVVAGVERGDEDAGSLPGGKHAEARELADRLARRRAADAELCGERGFAGKLRAERPFACADAFEQYVGRLIGE